MENKFFMPAGDLTDDDSKLIYSKTDTSILTPIRKSGEIEDDFFRPAGDLTDINSKMSKKINNNEKIIKKINNIDEIKDYLITIVSGKKYDNVCELGVLMESGRIIVTLEELMKMVDEGYNIVSANVINANIIEIEFQRYVYDEEKMKRWRRF